MNRQLRGNLPPNEKANGKNRFLSLLLLFMAFISVQVYAQDVKVSGTVIAEADKFPIIGANIVVKGTTIGTVTDIDGNFSLDVPQNSTIAISYIGCETQEIKITGAKTLNIVLKDNAIISYIGCETQEIKITGAKTLNIVLKDNAIGLDDVVVIGYGSQRKSDLTGGIVAVGEEKLQMVTTNNLMDKLAGQIPGMNVTTSNAKPGEDQSLRVRGENSLSADNSPLIVMDGIPYSGSLGDIDPDIIENMSVLKDASSAAIYGSRGANGVILIQTKKGKKGAPTVSYKGQVGMQQAQHRIDMMKGAEYVKYTQDYNRMKYGYSGDQLDPLVLLNPSERANYQNGSELDWQDIMFRNALTTSHQISISGGTEATTYMASISHLREDGVMENTGLKRTNIALNITQVLNKWLTVGMGTQAIQKEFGGEQPYLEAGLKMSPYGIYKDENDRYVDYPMDQTLFYNPMANIDATNDKTNRNVFISTFAEIQFPIDGLSFRTNFGYNYRNNFVGSYYGRNTLSGKKVNGSASIENIHYYDYTWENLLKYNKTFGLHKIDATALFSMQETTKKEAKESGESFVNDDSEYHNMAGAEKNKEITSKLTETAMLSYMLRLNYSYANKYLLTLTGRSDGYSAFGKNNKYAFFPSVAAAWNISSEEFMESQTNYLDMLKIRLSWGSNGNQAINPYQTLDRLTLTNYIWGDNGTVVNGAYLPTNGVGNPNLRWETSRTINAGIDFSFFNGRLSGNIDMYVVNTSDLLMSRTVPYMNGYKSIMDNVGKTRNKGVEIALNSVNFQNNDFRWTTNVKMSRTVPYMNGYKSIMDNVGKTRNKGVEIALNSVNFQNNDFRWTTNVNFSLNRDKIIELRGDGKDDITNKWFIGEPLRVFYDYNVVGTWQENETYVENGHTISWDAESGKFLNEEGKEYQKGAVPGSAKLEDKDGNGSITADDKKIIGSKLPSFLLSMGNRFDYKNIYFSFLLNGVFGQTKELHDYNFDRWMPTYNYISGMDYWTPENPTNEMTSPAYVPYDKHSFYKKMNYVNIKNITIGYTFPKTTLSAIGISSLSINASVNNLYTFSNIDNWLNLEDSDANRNVLVTYPTARSYMFGLNLTF